jgi:hypothetical protein
MNEQIVYKTNLDYPKQFRLKQFPPRRPATEPRPTEPLNPGDYVTLPLWGKGKTEGSENKMIPAPTYKVLSIDESFNVELELVIYRIGESLEDIENDVEIDQQ